MGIAPLKSGHIKMRPRARLISLIGDELISDEPVSLVELVKNAYDADATAVSITFPNPNQPKDNCIAIIDNGIGMSLDEVLEGWFEPGTIMKRKRDRSEKGRLLQGAKGIGRFAAARLAASLYMMTKKRGSPGVVVLLDWSKFDNDSYLDEVEIDYEEQPLPGIANGTTLQMMDLRREWTEDDFWSLHARLSRLISPFGTSNGSGDVENFVIELNIPQHPELTGEIKPHELTQEPIYKFTGNLSDRGQFTGSISMDGNTVKSFKTHQLGGTDESVLCGAFDVEIRAWDRDRTGLSPFMLKFSESLTGIRKILDIYCGVSIYRDGFRVHPYGESGNDWLSLDTRSRQTPTMRLANNQIIASIRIGRHENPKLKDRTTREGLVHNKAYDALIHWFKRILALLEEYRYSVRPRDHASTAELTTLYEAFDISEVVYEADKQLGKKHPITKFVRQKDTDIRKGVIRLQEHYSRVLLAAGLGQLVDLVIHEIGAPLGRANRELLYLEKMIAQERNAELSEAVTKSFSSIKAWMEQIANLRARLIPKAAGKRGRATTFAVQEEILGNILLFEQLSAKQKIEPPKLIAQKAPFAVHMARSNLGQVIANLIDNSIYWLTRHHGDGNGGRIEIRLTALEHGFRILFSDDGPGVPEEEREQIFDQNFSKKPNGMGLGLYIARQVMEPYGKLVYRADRGIGGACFEVIFERGVGL